MMGYLAHARHTHTQHLCHTAYLTNKQQHCRNHQKSSLIINLDAQMIQHHGAHHCTTKQAPTNVASYHANL
jgi:hypothetical protein